jgi:hypothetical protein
MARFSRHGWWMLTAVLTVPLAALAATVPHMFGSGTVISSSAVNDNFASLDSRSNALEAANATAAKVLTTSSSTTLTLAASSDGPYAGLALTLPAGTWLVQGQATLFTTVSSDFVRLGLYNGTTAAAIAGSISPATITASVNAGVALFTPPVVITVTASTTIQLMGYRNGASTLSFGAPTNLSTATAADTQRITAISLTR